MGEGRADAPANRAPTDDHPVNDFLKSLYSSQESWTTTQKDRTDRTSSSDTAGSGEHKKDKENSLPTVEFTGLLDDSDTKGGAGTDQSNQASQTKTKQQPADQPKPNPGPKPESAPTDRGAPAPKEGGGSEPDKKPARGIENAGPAQGNAPEAAGDKPAEKPGQKPGQPQEAARARSNDSVLDKHFDPKKTLTDNLKAQAKAGLGLKPNASDKELKDAIDNEIKALGADTYQQREEAKAKLTQAGPAAAEALARSSVQSPDAQIRLSSRQLLGKLTGNPEAIAKQSMTLAEIRNHTKNQDFSTGAKKLRDDFFKENKDVARLTPNEADGYKHVAAVLNKLSKEYSGTANANALERHRDRFAENETARNLLPANFGSLLTGKAHQDFRLNEPNRNAQSDGQVRDSLERALKAYPQITGLHTFNAIAQKLGLEKDPTFVKSYLQAGGQLKDLRRAK